MNNNVEEILCYKFRNRNLLCDAVRDESNLKVFERLEFLGDRVLSLALSDIIFNRFPKESDGELAVRIAYLAQAKTLLRVSEKNSIFCSNNSTSIADKLEALLGAIYLDGGFDSTKSVIEKLWNEEINKPISKMRDPKTILQEFLQGNGKDLPVYSTVSRSGPEHKPTFCIQAKSPSHNKSEEGCGLSKREAEQNAALKLLETLKQKN